MTLVKKVVEAKTVLVKGVRGRKGVVKIEKGLKGFK
jgi:hypothetical protein